jgi:hypothetical protein
MAWEYKLVALTKAEAPLLKLAFHLVKYDPLFRYR